MTDPISQEAARAKHTPGPWRAGEVWRPPIGTSPRSQEGVDSRGNVFWGYAIYGRASENGPEILPTLGAVHNFPENIHANARLIAAAPTLLEALIAVHAPYKTLTEEALRDGVLMEHGPPKPDRGAAQLLVRAAISLATGGE